MKKVSSMAAATTAVGIDVGDRFSHWCALNKAGEVVGRGRMRTTAEAVSEQARTWRGARVAIENGTHSGWMSRALTQAGCQTTVANPSRWRGTAHMSKNDRNDAEALARVVRLDPQLLFPIEHRSEQHQQDLAVIRARAQLVKARTQLVNTVRGLVKSLGGRLPRADAAYFTQKTWSDVPTSLRPALAPLYRILAALNQEISILDREIEQLSQKRYPRPPDCAACPASARSPPSPTCSLSATRTASRAAATPARTSACVPDNARAGTATRSWASPKTATATCAPCWSSAPTTCSAAAPTPPSNAGDWLWPRAARESSAAPWSP
jgi:hypothetical protein